MVSRELPRVSNAPSLGERSCFAAGQAKSGTTLLIALLDDHPQLLVLPEETAYFPTTLHKYGPAGRHAQFQHLTSEALSRVLFGAPPEWEAADYRHFPMAEFRERFESAAFAPANRDRDLLVILVEAYAAVLGRPLQSIVRWIEKTPANRRFIPQIQQRFPEAKLLLTLRDPRAILAAQIALERTRRTREFSVYYCVSHWLQAARLALRAQTGQLPALVTRYEDLVRDPVLAMKRVCAFLGVEFDQNVVLTPTKAGQLWKGNSASEQEFSAITPARAESWQTELTAHEIGWVEWHCRELMPLLGYEPRFGKRQFRRHWLQPIRQERSRQYVKSRYYSIRDKLLGPRNK